MRILVGNYAHFFVFKLLPVLSIASGSSNSFGRVLSVIENILQAAPQISNVRLYFLSSAAPDLEVYHLDITRHFSEIPNQIFLFNKQKTSEWTHVELQHNIKATSIRYSTSDTFIMVFMPNWRDVSTEIFAIKQTTDNLYFVFHQQQYSEGLLWSQDLYKLPNKVEIRSESTKETELELWTVCLYCNGGLPMDLQVEFSNFEQIYPDFTTNMNGSVLHATSSNGLEFSMNFKKTSDGTVELDGGFSNQLFLCLQQRHNFRFHITLHSVFGKRQPNGTFNGFLNEMQAEEAEYTMEIAALMERSEVINFLPITHHANLVFFTRAPLSAVTDWSIVRRPFKSDLWLAVCLTILILVVVQAAIMLMMAYKNQQNESFNIALCNRSADYVLRPLLDQGIEDKLWDKNGFLKLIGLLWIICSIILTTAYRAKLTVLRSQTKTEDIPKTFAELEASDYEIYLHYVGGSFIKSFEGARNPILIAVRNRFILERNVSRCFEMVLTRRAACVTTNANGIVVGYKNFSTINGQPALAMAEDFAFTLISGPATSKRAPFFSSFAKTVMNLIDTGIVRVLQKNEAIRHRRNGKEWAKLNGNEKWRQIQPDGPSPIVVSELLGLLLVCAGVVILSALILAVELAPKKKFYTTHGENNAPGHRLKMTALLVSARSNVQKLYTGIRSIFLRRQNHEQENQARQPWAREILRRIKVTSEYFAVYFVFNYLVWWHENVARWQHWSCFPGLLLH